MTKQSTIIYEHWAMGCCGEPLTVGEYANISANDVYEHFPFDAEFAEGHHESHKYELYGKVVSIKAVFVDKYANPNRCYVDDSNNTFFVCDATYIDGRQDIGDFQDHKVADIVYYLIVLEDVELKQIV
jgi:hypothetical protein